MDGDLSGGPLIDIYHRDVWTPAAVGPRSELDLPYANAAYDYVVLQAKWTHTVVDMSRRLVAFTDQSVGQVTAWKWESGDGDTSTEQHPQHAYSRGGDFVVTLEVSGPDGTSRFQRVWDVSVR